MQDPRRTAATAMVLRDVGTLRRETVLVDDPEPFEVQVRVANVGVCHSDQHYVDGTHRTQLPEVLGHEASGIVTRVGEHVSTVSVGDPVVTSLTMFCGRCRYCVAGRLSLCAQRARLRARARPALVSEQGEAIGAMGGIGAFAELAVLHENALVRVPDDLPLPVASLFGCAVLTGVCAVTRAARVPVGATVAVVGCGGIGVAAIQGATLAGASRIVAIDRDPAKLGVARGFGATDALLADGQVEAALEALIPDGVQFSFEAVGRAETAELAFAILSPGGTCTVLGMVPDSTPIRVRPSALYFEERRLQGAFIGSSRFTSDVPELSELYRQGRLRLDEMITHRFPLEQLGEAFAALARGEVVRAVLDVRR